mmetsp:Transcript_41998/g.105354  ORF Transcript_41998/g.105354 Transcript_41998/m.105354 type:complete len:209 (-) Transcript_41998:122-748(-)
MVLSMAAPITGVAAMKWKSGSCAPPSRSQPRCGEATVMKCRGCRPRTSPLAGSNSRPMAYLDRSPPNEWPMMEMSRRVGVAAIRPVISATRRSPQACTPWRLRLAALHSEACGSRCERRASAWMSRTTARQSFCEPPSPCTITTRWVLLGGSKPLAEAAAPVSAPRSSAPEKLRTPPAPPGGGPKHEHPTRSPCDMPASRGAHARVAQ